VDARSEGFGVTDPTPNPTKTRTGTLQGGNLGPLNYSERVKTWAPGHDAVRRDVLHLAAHNLAAVTIHPARAHLSCHPQLQVTTDGPLRMTLAGCGRTLRFG
jgi:hypothetical protein